MSLGHPVQSSDVDKLFDAVHETSGRIMYATVPTPETNHSHDVAQTDPLFLGPAEL